MLIKFKPITPGLRGTVLVSKKELSNDKPHKSLTKKFKSTGGRNNQGRITSRRMGGGVKRKYRLIDFKDVEERKGVDTIKIELKYYNGSPVIKKIKRISKPGIRKYSKISELSRPFGGLGISILSTPKGVMSDQEAKKNNVGGEVLCEVF